MFDVFVFHTYLYTNCNVAYELNKKLAP